MQQFFRQRTCIKRTCSFIMTSMVRYFGVRIFRVNTVCIMNWGLGAEEYWRLIYICVTLENLGDLIDVPPLFSWEITFVCFCLHYCTSVLLVLRFYGPVNPMGSSRARSIYLTTRLLDRLSPLSGLPVLCTFFRQKLTTALLESLEGRE